MVFEKSSKRVRFEFRGLFVWNFECNICLEAFSALRNVLKFAQNLCLKNLSQKMKDSNKMDSKTIGKQFWLWQVCEVCIRKCWLMWFRNRFQLIVSLYYSFGNWEWRKNLKTQKNVLKWSNWNGWKVGHKIGRIGFT